MKKCLILLFMSVLLTGCSDELSAPMSNAELNEIPEASETTIRSIDEAVEIAQKAVAMISDATPASRSGNIRKVDSAVGVKAITTAGVNVASRASEKSDTLMYVVNYADNMGFALVGAPRSAPELLAVTVAGNYDPSKPTDNPGFNLYMDCATQYLQECAKASSVNAANTIIPPGGFPFKPAPEYKEISDTTVTSNVGNRVQVYWGQYDPEGALCSNGKAGCSNTAMAMAMSYFGIPKSIKINFDGTRRDLNLNWERLRFHNAMLIDSKQCDESNCDGMSTHECLAYLCAELGYLSNSRYLDQTSTSTVNVASVLRGFGYTVTKNENTTNNCSNDLANDNSILLMFGSGTYKDEWRQENITHMWVCDAVYAYNVHTVIYERPGGIYATDSGWTYYDTYDTYKVYYFYNWGYGASYADMCGFFLSNCFTAKHGTEIFDFTKNIGYLKVTL